MVGFRLPRLDSYLKKKNHEQSEKLIKARLGMLALAEELENVYWSVSWKKAGGATLLTTQGF